MSGVLLSWWRKVVSLASWVGFTQVELIVVDARRSLQLCSGKFQKRRSENWVASDRVLPVLIVAEVELA